MTRRDRQRTVARVRAVFVVRSAVFVVRSAVPTERPLRVVCGAA
jgi:hypothetical protein